MNDIKQTIPQTNSFYAQILGLTEEWQVTGTRLDLESKQVVIEVEFAGKEARCPECGALCKIHDRPTKRKWRHLDTCQFHTVIECRVPRVKCGEHSVKTVAVPWSEAYGRFTFLFEAFAIEVLLACQSQRKAARLLEISFDEIHLIQTRAVERGLSRRKEEPIERVGLDEKAMKKGHHYLTVLTEIRPGGGRVIDVAEERTAESAKGLLREGLSEDQRKGVRSVSMDMWGPYEEAAKELLPKSEVVFDRFHVEGHMGKAVDLTRREEFRKLQKKDQAKAEAMKRSKYMFLRNIENLPDDHLLRFHEARAVAEQTSKAWMWKEALKGFWTQPTMELGRRYLENWLQMAGDSGVKAVVKVVKMIQKKFQGVLNYLSHRVTNATAESINGKIQVLKSNARGFRAFKNYRINILFYFGKLDLLPQTSP